MTALLEVAIGLIALYLILSLVVSAVNEGLAGISKRRAAFLEEGIRNLLGDPIAKRFFSHGLVTGLSRKRSGRPGRPSYISGPVFSRVVLDIVSSAGAAPPAPPQPAQPAVGPRLPGLLGSGPDPQLTAVQAALKAMTGQGQPGGDGDPTTAGLGQALTVLAMESRDMSDLETKVEGWYDEAMDRVSGWYKRRTSLILFGLGIVLVAALNADTVNVAETLWAHPDLRSAVVSQAEKISQQPGVSPTATVDAAASAVTGLAQLKIPLGWVASTTNGDPRAVPADTGGWLLKIGGLLLTGIALSFGAPFWFDLLKSFVSIRSSGPAPAESASAGSGSSH